MTTKKNWIWYFSILGLLGTLAVVVPILYNLGLQLEPEQLENAKQLWKAHGISSYDLIQEVKIDNQKKADEYKIEVRAGVITSVTCNKETISVADPNAMTIPELFELIERGLELDQQPDQRRTYAVAYFDKHDGHPVRYIRRKKSSSQRLEINIKLTPIKD